MTAKNDVMPIHGIQGSSIGIILVLFILLVIVTSMFSFSPYDPYENESVGIESNQTFRVFNQTTAYKLNLVSFSNIQNPGTRTLDPGASQALVLTSTSGLVYYTVLNNNNNAYVGAFSANMSSTAGFSINQYSGPIVPVVLLEDPYRLVVRYSIP
ncbi:hypothetical protein [Paenibacillus herberti]|uniref:Uncharacterized protein n=1 Tax=Paenibacillus herberti TaxID=1619309 RepID=A0A229P0Y4_9BACL|nr:hypothetical protein [Paenibacillus herberti]OXM15788.1 hypothetical protein CGZ75_03455 [Paenibacillus herberti]